MFTTFVNVRSNLIRLTTAGFFVVSGTYARDASADPTRLWGTYYGGSEYDSAHDISFSGDDSVVIVGRTDSNSGIASAGAHDVAYGGNTDAFVAKFSDSGSLEWGTYYGGSGEDLFSGGVAIDTGDNIYALGTTQSGSGIHSSGAHKTSLSGAYDAMLVKFNENGVRSWGTYFGGNGNDYGNGICVASTGTVYIVGGTTSTNLAVNALHDGSYNSGPDAFVAKVTSSGTVLWATYYGHSSGNTDAYDCAVDSNHNIYVTGNTEATGGIASGGHDNSYNGDSDAFLVKFDTNGNRTWATYYGGSGADFAYAVAVDDDDNVYIAGATGSSNFIATGGAHSTSLAGAFDAFVAKFNSSGTRQWGTYFGSENSGMEISVDTFTDMEIIGESIHLSGSTNSDDAPISTWDAYDVNYGDWYDPMFVTMSTDDSDVFYSSYNGGTAPYQPGDYGNGVATTHQYSALCGNTISTGDIATSGTHDTSHNGSHDVFITYIRNFSVLF